MVIFLKQHNCDIFTIVMTAITGSNYNICC